MFGSTNLSEIFVTAKYYNCFVVNILPILFFFNFGIKDKKTRKAFLIFRAFRVFRKFKNKN
jgi:hypothetical protein